jgi:hypothetical protein
MSALAAWGCAETWGPAAGAAAFAGGTLIDLDHLADWFLNGRRGFSVRAFVDACVRFKFRRFFLLAHSAEWILPFLVWAGSGAAPPTARAFALGLALHVVMDLLGNGTRPLFWSLVYRAAQGFRADAFVVRLPPEALDWWGDLDRWRRWAGGDGPLPTAGFRTRASRREPAA